MSKTGFILISAAICFFVVPTFAQVPSGNIFVGYSFTKRDIFPQSVFLQPSRSANFNGWEASVEGKFLPFIGIVADVGQSYGSASFPSVCQINPPACPPPSTVTVNSRVLTLTLGPRVSVPIGRFTPFAHALFGGAHVTNSGAASNSDTSFASEIGGGIDYKFIKGVAWRFQGDAVHTRFFGSTQNDFRFSTGLVLRF